MTGTELLIAAALTDAGLEVLQMDTSGNGVVTASVAPFWLTDSKQQTINRHLLKHGWLKGWAYGQTPGLNVEVMTFRD